MKGVDYSMALIHEFLLMTNTEYRTLNFFDFYNSNKNNLQVNAHLNDDLFGYMRDSFKWIKTKNLDNNKEELGFNYYGTSLIDKSTVIKLIEIMNCWHNLFLNAPSEMELTGHFQWIEGEDPVHTGKYEKLKFDKNEVIKQYKKLIEFGIKVRDEDYVLVYFGI